MYIARADGTSPRKLTATSAAGLTWSRDGRSIRYTVGDPARGGTTVWEIAASGGNAHMLMPQRYSPKARWGEGQAAAAWTADGRFFLFREAFFPHIGLWALPAGRTQAAEFYSTGLDLGTPVPSRDGKHLYVIGKQPTRELVRFDKARQEFVPYMTGLSALETVLSPDGKWIAYTAFPGNALWRARADGSERMQLTQGPLQVFGPKWSPDGAAILFHGLEPEKKGKNYIIGVQGGVPTELLAGGQTEENVPCWSADGKRILMSRGWRDDKGAFLRSADLILDLATGALTEVPGSENMGPPSWSPNGRYIAAQTSDFRELLLFDFTTGKWKRIASGKFIHNPQWSRDSRQLIYQDRLADEQPVYRIAIPTLASERLASRANFLRGDVVRYSMTGLTPDGMPIAVIGRENANVYALDIEQ